jgi:Recombinase
MRVVRRIFHQVSDGQTLCSIKRSLECEGVPAPEGGRYWNVTFLRNVVLADVYQLRSYAEVEELVAPEVVARLDQEKFYGIFWFNRTRTTRKRVSTLGSNGREYRWQRPAQ